MAEIDSILTSIKKMLGPDEEETHFDPDIVMYINAAIMDLTQVGVGPQDGYFIKDKEDKWSDFISEDSKKFEAVKTYIEIQVRLVFDPPQSAAAIASFNAIAAKILERLRYNAEGYT